MPVLGQIWPFLGPKSNFLGAGSKNFGTLISGFQWDTFFVLKTLIIEAPIGPYVRYVSTDNNLKKMFNMHFRPNSCLISWYSFCRYFTKYNNWPFQFDIHIYWVYLSILLLFMWFLSLCFFRNDFVLAFVCSFLAVCVRLLCSCVICGESRGKSRRARLS